QIYLCDPRKLDCAAERCTADPGPPRAGTIPVLQRTAAHFSSDGHSVAALRPGYVPTTTRQPHMMPMSALKSMRVMFATPCYISAVSMIYVASMFSLALDSTHVGLPCILHMHRESLITRGRNKMVIKFLSEEFTTCSGSIPTSPSAHKRCFACCWL